MPKCDRCPERATKGTYNLVEIPRAPGDWREFRDAGQILNGCAQHPPESFVTYIDGRVIRSAQQVPEKVPEPGQ
jgi:hypothetical protein